MESGVDFVACDFPEANRLTVHILAAVAEHEAGMISARTKAALGAARARGVTLGGVRGDPKRMRPMAAKGTRQSAIVRREMAARRQQDLFPVIDDLRLKGASSLRQIASGLNDAGLTAPRGGKWTAAQVVRLSGGFKPNGITAPALNRDERALRMSVLRELSGVTLRLMY
jgi:DNA invertase Pin-like site-specific DNA recombinase